jgi:hypothetical protein
VGRVRLMPETGTEYMRPPRLSASALRPPGRALRSIDGSRLLVRHCPTGGKWVRSEIADGTALGCQRPPASDARWMISTPHDRCSSG